MCAGVGYGGGFRKVPEGSGVCWGSEGSGEFRCGLWPCNLDGSSHVMITRITLSTWAKPLRKKAPM